MSETCLLFPLSTSYFLNIEVAIVIVYFIFLTCFDWLWSRSTSVVAAANRWASGMSLLCQALIVQVNEINNQETNINYTF
jgi:hypothetical protein